MKVKFENCEVDLWKVRQGCVVMASGYVGHIGKIGFSRMFDPKLNIYQMDIVTTEVDLKTMSDGVTWLEPH